MRNALEKSAQPAQADFEGVQKSAYLRWNVGCVSADPQISAHLHIYTLLKNLRKFFPQTFALVFKRVSAFRPSSQAKEDTPLLASKRRYAPPRKQKKTKMMD